MTALIRLLSSVDSLVYSQREATAEALPTLIALVGLLPSVSSQVLGQIGAFPEGFPTVMAREGFFSRMDAIMPGERGPCTEDLSTLSTFMVILAPRVDSLVAFQVTTGTEDMKTLVTLIGLFPSVNSYVKSEG